MKKYFHVVNNWTEHPFNLRLKYSDISWDKYNFLKLLKYNLPGWEEKKKVQTEQSEYKDQLMLVIHYHHNFHQKASSLIHKPFH